MAFDLNLSGDQLTIGGVAGLVQRGFMHINAAGVTGFSVNITGSGAANRLAGGAEQDSIVGGLGADTIGMDVTGGYDEIDAGLVAEGNELRLTGDASEVQFVNLALNGDQLTTGAGTQSGFMHFDASAMEIFGVNVTGSAAGNRITGTAMQDTIAGGLGADIVTMDVAAYDQIDAGNGSEGDVLRLVGTASGSFTVDLGVAAGGDQLLLIDAAAEAVVQSDFQHLDVAKLSGGFGVVARGSGANNNLTGTAFQDRFTGRAGADLIDLGADPVTGLSDGEEDRVFYESVADGSTAAAAAVSRDRIVHFDAGQDRVVFVGEFNITGADTDTNSANLDDIENNDSFVFAVNERANFSVEDEAMFLGAATAKLTDADLYGGGLVNLTARINAVGVSAVAGDDGLIVVQGKKTTGIYYYQELAGGGVQANELTVLGIIDKLVQQNDFEFG
jgi:hypothetical protein